MQKNEFEKQMQQKMDELRIHPSESVWENVQLQITKKKRRRWGVILLLSGFIIISSGGYWLFRSNNQRQQHYQYNKTEKKNSDQASTTDKPLTKTGNKNLDEDNKISGQIVTIKSNKNVSKKIIHQSAGVLRIHNGSSENTFTELNDAKNFNRDTKTQNEVIPHADEVKPDLKEVEKNEITNANNYKDSLIFSSLANKINLKNDTSENSPTKHTIAPKQNHKWKLGILFSAGISGVADNFLGVGGEDKSFADRYSNASQGTSGGPNNGANSPVIPSKTERSGAFIIGVFAEKNISKKIKFSAGINYKYFSTTNRVGEKNDTTGYFRVNNSGNKYHNSFHFIELPASLKFQLGNGKKIPIFLSGGFVISQLINSNSLEYNLTSQSYSANNSLFNKTQIGFTTGLSAALFLKQKTKLLIGPDFYFGATSLARNGLYTKKHFSYIGLRSEITFRKK